MYKTAFADVSRLGLAGLRATPRAVLQELSEATSEHQSCLAAQAFENLTFLLKPRQLKTKPGA